MSGENKGGDTTASVGMYKLAIECGDMSFESEILRSLRGKWDGLEVDEQYLPSIPSDFISFRRATMANQGSIVVITPTPYQAE